MKPAIRSLVKSNAAMAHDQISTRQGHSDPAEDYAVNLQERCMDLGASRVELIEAQDLYAELLGPLMEESRVRFTEHGDR